MVQHPTEVYEAKYRGPAGHKKRLALWHQEVLKVLNMLDKSQQPLEVGCGNGHLLARIVEMGFDALGVDVSSEAVKRCQERNLKASRC